MHNTKKLKERVKHSKSKESKKERKKMDLVDANAESR